MTFFKEHQTTVLISVAVVVIFIVLIYFSSKNASQISYVTDNDGQQKLEVQAQFAGEE